MKGGDLAKKGEWFFWGGGGGGGFDTSMLTMRMLAGMGFNILSAHFCEWNYNDPQIWNENEWKKN